MSAQPLWALNDVGWTILAVVACYWVGEAMGSTDFKDLEKTPKKVLETAKMVASNAAHVAFDEGKLTSAERLRVELTKSRDLRPTLKDSQIAIGNLLGLLRLRTERSDGMLR